MRILARLSTAQIEYLPVGEIIATDELQKRRPEVMDEKARALDERQRADLIKSITASLKGDPKFESTAIRVVRCAPPEESDPFGIGEEPVEGNYLVDGFHRYQAYLMAGREVVPVQLVEGVWAEAHEAATAMNNHTKTVGVDKVQQLQQAWEMVNLHFEHEQLRLEQGWSARRIAEAVGPSRQTIDNMVQKVKELGRSASGMSWAKAKSSTSRKEFTELQRLSHVVRRTLELAELAHGDHELDMMSRVLSDYRNGVLGYDPDIDEYVGKVLEADPDVQDF